MDLPEEITPESAQKLLRMAEELMVTRQALEHALQEQSEPRYERCQGRIKLGGSSLRPGQRGSSGLARERAVSPESSSLNSPHFEPSSRCQSAASTPLCS